MKSLFLSLARHTPIPAFKRSFFRKFCRKNIGLSDTITCLNGHKMHVSIGDSVDNLIYVYRAFEPATTRIISTLAPHCSTFFDIGSNIGYYSALVSSIDPDKKIIAVDPNPEMCSRTEQNLSLNQAQNHHVLNLGIGAEPGELQLNIPKNRHSLASFAFEPDRGGESNTITCQITTTSNLISEHQLDHIFLKIDTEGFEREVLQGTTAEAIDKIHFILLEFAGPNMKQAGYSPAELLQLDLFKKFDLYEINDDHPEQRLKKVSNPNYDSSTNINVLLVNHNSTAQKLLEKTNLI